MELKITTEKENALFNRKEITGTMDSEITPSRADTLKSLSEKFKVPEGNIKIKGINGKFGSKTFRIEANIYSSEEDKDKAELKKKKDAPAPVKQEEAKPETASGEVATPPAESEQPKEGGASSEPAKEESKEEAKPEEKPAEESKPQKVKGEAAE